jgi:hypothetical protein
MVSPVSSEAGSGQMPSITQSVELMLGAEG